MTLANTIITMSTKATSKFKSLEKFKFTRASTREITVQMAIENFLEIDTMGKSFETKDWYKKRLDLFARHIGAERTITSVLEIDLLNWYKKLVHSKLTIDTQHGYIRAVRKFFKFLHTRKILQVNMASDLKLPKLPKRARKGISEENMIAILNAAKDDPRDYALLRFLESTNARRAGIATLRLSALSLDLPEPLCRRVLLYEKGSNDRTAVMSHETLLALKQWLSVRQSNCDYVFTTKRKETKLTVSGVSEIINRYKTKLDLQGRCSPHQWRHRWCRKQIQEGMPLSLVSQLAGHTSIVVTADYYGTFAFNELQEAFDRYYKPPIIKK